MGSPGWGVGPWAAKRARHVLLQSGGRPDRATATKALKLSPRLPLASFLSPPPDSEMMKKWSVPRTEMPFSLGFKGHSASNTDTDPDWSLVLDPVSAQSRQIPSPCCPAFPTQAPELLLHRGLNPPPRAFSPCPLPGNFWLPEGQKPLKPEQKPSSVPRLEMGINSSLPQAPDASGQLLSVASETQPPDPAQGTHASATTMSQTKTLKVRVTLFCILAGIVLATTAVVSDHWAVLSPHLEHHNTTCEAAHFGLWRICTKRIPMDDSKTCGPITLPGDTEPTPVSKIVSIQAASSQMEPGVYLVGIWQAECYLCESHLSYPAGVNSCAPAWHSVALISGPPLGRVLTNGFPAGGEAAECEIHLNSVASDD
ncbi:Voltage-dependent calcium channel gamma-1 subunit [Plecturocebus cupreus]